MTEQTGPACGNNPRFKMSDGDRRVVENFKACLAARAALLSAADWYVEQGKTVLAASQVAADLRRRADVEMRRMADAPPADQTAHRTAVLREVEQAVRQSTSNCSYKADDGCDFCNGVDAALDQVRRIAGETQPTKADPSFFQPGRTYTSGTASALPPAPQWTFKVTTVAESPRGDRVALGFLTSATYGCGVWTPHGEYDMAGWAAVGARQAGPQPGDPTCICGHPKSQHLKVSGRLLCDACDPDSTENLVCKEFDAL